MAKSALLRQSDLLPLMRHLADVAALRHEPGRQRQVLIDGLSKLLGTYLGWWFTMDDWRPEGRPHVTQQVLTTDPDPHWVRYMGEFATNMPLTADPYADRSLHCKDREQQWFFERIVHDRQTRRQYADTLDLMKLIQIRDGAVCALRLGKDGSRIVGFSLHRHMNSRRMTGRDHALAALALREIDGLIQRGHLVPREDESHPLPPRLRQVLACLLRGDSPRKIALSLGISVHTVREHIDRLYDRFEVHSREDLMAKFVR